MGNLSAARLVFNEADIFSAGQDDNEALNNGETFVDGSQNDVAPGDYIETDPGSGYMNANGDMVPVSLNNFDVIPVVTAGLAGFYGYQKFAKKKHGWAYVAGIAALGLLAGKYVSKGIYSIKSKI